MKSVLDIEYYDEKDLISRKRQFLGGSCNYKMIYGFIFTDENNANSFILSITDDDYYLDTENKSVRASNGKQYINPDFNEFKYIVMELLGGKTSNEVFEAFYVGLMTQTVDMGIKFKASTLMLMNRLSFGNSIDYDIIRGIISGNLILEDKDAMLHDIFDSIQAILSQYEYKPRKLRRI